MNEPSEEKKAHIVAARAETVKQQAVTLEKTKARINENLARTARFQANVKKKFSKHDIKPKLTENDKEALRQHFLNQLRSEEAQIASEYVGMEIGMMLEAETNPSLRGLVAGLSGLLPEDVEEKNEQ
jgi:transcriptional regulator of NAD metabolism